MTITTNTAFEPKARSRYEALVRALPERDNRLLARKIVLWVMTEFKVEDPSSWEAVAVTERYAEGLATVEELLAARAAAGAASVVVSFADAESVSGDAREAARAAAATAARAAAADAADGAVWAAQEAAVAAAAAAREGYVGAARAAAGAAAEAATYKMFFEWAMELAIGEKVAA